MEAVNQPTLRPLATGQLGIWVAQNLQPENPLYNAGDYLDILGPIDPKLFEAALRQVVEEADALRLRVIETGDGPRQFIAADRDWKLPIIDVSADPHPQTAAEAWMREDLARVSDLTRGPFFRYALFRLAPDRFFWYMCHHHVCVDGTGALLVGQRVASVYTAMAEGRSPEPKKPGSWFDLLKEQEDYRQSSLYQQHRAYWRDRLAELPEPVMLSAKPPTLARREIHCTDALAQSVVARLRALGESHRAGLPLVIFTAAAIYLHLITGARDLLFGVLANTRLVARTRHIVGRVSNVLPLRLQVDRGDGLEAVLKQASTRLFEMAYHQRYRSEDLREDLGLAAHPPEMFGLMVNVRPFYDGLHFGGSPARGRIVSNGAPRGLAVYARDCRHGDLEIDFDANPALYTEEELAGHLRRFMALLGQLAAAAPDTPLRRFDLLDDGERHTLLDVFNATARLLPQATLPELFEAQVSRDPEAAAVVLGDRIASYREVNERANRLAHELIRLGVGPERVVGIALERSFEMVVAMVAVLKAGGACLPLRPDDSDGRLADLLADASPSVILSTRNLRVRLPTPAPVLELDGLALEVAPAQVPAHDPKDHERTTPLRPDHPAYVSYARTPGFNESLQAFVLPQAALVNLTAWNASCNSSGRVAQLHSINLIVSLQETLHALLSGKSLAIIDDETRRQPRKLAAFLGEAGISELFVPYRLLEQVAEAALDMNLDLPWLTHVYQTGEELTVTPALRRFFTKYTACHLHYLHGTAEIPVITAAILPADPAAWPYNPSIGAPIWNTRVYLLNEVLEPVPIGVPGELFASGIGLARGDVAPPALTAERYVAELHAKDPGQWMYRTGDLARWRSDGTLEFLGRVDQPMKIRGIRIDRGEIEAMLTARQGIAQAVVLVRDDGPQDEQLVAYVVPVSGTTPNVADLRTNLAEALPPHWVPAAFVALAALPLTPDGKLDRQALPAPGLQAETYYAPRTPEEETLCSLYAELLRLERVGIEDDFFTLGGHSLLVIQLVTLIEKTFEIRLPVSAVFHARTVRQLAEILRERAWSSELFSLVPIKATGPRLPLFIIQSDSWELVRYLDPEQPVYGLNYGVGAKTTESMLNLPGRLEDLAAHYVREIQLVQPQGPYFLLGHSAAGLVAYEMAQQLVARGHEIALLGMIDTYYLQNNGKASSLPFRKKLLMLFKLPVKSKVIMLRGSIYHRFQSMKFKFLANKSEIPILNRGMHLWTSYVPKTYTGKVSYWKCLEPSHFEPVGNDELQWEELAREGIQVHEVPCHHGEILVEPHVKILAEQINQYLSNNPPAEPGAFFNVSRSKRLVLGR